MKNGGTGPARELGRRLVERDEMLALAESCTGGLLAARLTAVDGASEWLWGGVVVYTADAKVRLLGVDTVDLAEHGTVGTEITRSLARSARRRAGVAWGLAVTCWAGPTGGTPSDPPGTVYLALDGPLVSWRRLHLDGGRERVRSGAAAAALDLLLEKLQEAPSAETRGGRP